MPPAFLKLTAILAVRGTFFSLPFPFAKPPVFRGISLTRLPSLRMLALTHSVSTVPLEFQFILSVTQLTSTTLSLTHALSVLLLLSFRMELALTATKLPHFTN